MGVGTAHPGVRAALVAGTLALAGCGGSGSTVCSRWAAHASSDRVQADRYGRQFAAQFDGLPGDPPAKLQSIAHASAASYFRLTVTQDLASSRWHAAARCPAPRF